MFIFSLNKWYKFYDYRCFVKKSVIISFNFHTTLRIRCLQKIEFLHELIECLDDFVKYLHQYSEIEKIIRIIIILSVNEKKRN